MINTACVAFLRGAKIALFGLSISLLPLHADPQVTYLGTLGGRADGVAINAQGEVVVCDVADGTIWLHDPLTGLNSIYYQFKDGSQPCDCCFDAIGNLVVADALDKRIVQISPDKTLRVLTAPDARLLGPKNLVVADDGTVYFTDFSPSTAFSTLPNDQHLPSQLWKLSPAGELTLLNSFWDMKPTGIKFQGSTLFVVNSSLSVIYQMNLSGGYSLFASPALYFDQGGNTGPDGIDIAADGTVYVALYGEGAVGVFDPSGKELQRIAIPAPNVTSVALSLDGQKLFVSEASTNNVYEVTQLPVNPPLTRTDVLTWHNDNTRTGQNQDELLLTPQNIQNNFGLLSTLPVNGPVSAQPLFIYQQKIPGAGSHNIVYVATESDTVYAFDADTYELLWQTILVPVDDLGNYQELPTGGIGVTSTPVIDRSVGPNGTIYVVAMSEEVNASGQGTNIFHQRVHLLDLATGDDYRNTEVLAVCPGSGPGSDGSGYAYFEPGQQRDRCALTLLNGTLYTSWASVEAKPPYAGWLIGFDQHTLNQTAVFNTNPNGIPVSTNLPDGSGGSFWNSGAGPAADNLGNLYGVTANGPFDSNLNNIGFPTNGDFGDSIIKFSTAGGLVPNDYFTPFNEFALATADSDLGSGGVILLPDLFDAGGKVRHLAVGAGKDSNIYVVDRDQMGKFAPGGNKIYQELDGALPYGMWATAAYFNGRIYYGPTGPSPFYPVPLNQMVAFTINNARLSSSPTAKASTLFHYPGATPSVSANGNTSGVVWAVENGVSANARVTPPVPHGLASLHAYDAADISVELYNRAGSSRNGQDNFGIGNKFIVPTVVNGKVFVGTTDSVAVFGLLNNPVTLLSANSCQVAPNDHTDLDLPLGLSLSTQTTETRLGLTPTPPGPGRDFAVVLNFSDQVDPSQAEVKLLAQDGSAVRGAPWILPGGLPSKQVVVALLNIEDNQKLLIQLDNLLPLSLKKTVPPISLPITFKLKN